MNRRMSKISRLQCVCTDVIVYLEIGDVQDILVSSVGYVWNIYVLYIVLEYTTVDWCTLEFVAILVVSWGE